ncbi:MAG: FliA/WhiG family RNA polymerase sigma factor [Candidatus Atribacteria bacterium]|nr:FliA/WhiG family RNA polymerase sigma factor [Candidatus Atribacteria bacterium]MCD6349303.1 FliA/WhiG family RNA polymerase sigma factor [Candidatus Atribacteria bacterium]
MKAAEKEKLWEKYFRDRDPETKEELVISYLYLVKIAIGRLLYLLPSHVDREDLESYGVLGLIQALERFRPQKGLKFETYALSRIRGAVLDYLRSLDPLTRTQRKNLREVIQAWREFESKEGREPTLEELAERVGFSVEELSWLIEQSKGNFLLSLEEKIPGSDNSLGDVIREKREHLDPEKVLEKKELMEALSKAVEELPEREKICLTLYYYEGLTLKEIGSIIGLGESRVSQLISRALLRIKSKILVWEEVKDG